MIFVTVGTQLPFDRLVRQVDEWAAARQRDDVFAQIGPTQWQPRHIRWVRELPPAEFQANFEQADAIVAHAGMGTIISAMEFAKPLIVMPRLARYREQRNDHQLATARSFGSLSGLRVTEDEESLIQALDALEELGPAKRKPSMAHAQLIDALRQFINDPSEMLQSSLDSVPLEHATSSSTTATPTETTNV